MEYVRAIECISRQEYIDNHLTKCGPSDEDICPICADEWDPENQIIVSTTCGHVYHKACILAWFNGDVESSNTCPSCRRVCFHYRDGDEDDSDSDSDYDPESEISLPFGVSDIDDESEQIQEMMTEAAFDLTTTFHERFHPIILQQRHGIDITNRLNAYRFRAAIDQVYEDTSPFIRHYPTNIPDLSPEGITVVGNSILRALVVVGMIQRNGSLMSLDEWVELLFDLSQCRRRAIAASNITEGRDTEEVLESLHLIWTWIVPPSPTYTIKLSARRPGEKLQSILYLALEKDGSLYEEGNVHIFRAREDIFSTQYFSIVYYPSEDGGDELRIYEYECGSIWHASLADNTRVLSITTRRGPSLDLSLRFRERAYA